MAFGRLRPRSDLNHSDGAVAIGLVEGNTLLPNLVGWETTSWGFHSDDGSIVVENEVKNTGPTFGNGEIVGVTVFWEDDEMKMTFTLDGKCVGECFVYTQSVAKRILMIRSGGPYTVSGQLFPAVSFLQGQSREYNVRINFGPKDGGDEFMYQPHTVGLQEEPTDQSSEDERSDSDDEAETR